MLLNAGDGTFPTNIELPGGSAYTSGGSAHVHKVDCGGLDGDGDLGGLLGNISRDSRVLPGGSAYTSGGLRSAHVHKVDCGGLDGDGDLGGLLGNISRDSRVLLNAGEAPSFLNC